MKIGLIGGSGLEKLNILEDSSVVQKETQYGSPSSSFFAGTYHGSEILILSRHNRDHSIPPTHVNNRANIQAMKDLGCDCIIATTACGSLREEIGVGDIVIPDQFIDFTRHRINTFHDTFEEGKLGHASISDPFSDDLRRVIIASATKLGIPHHPAGTIVTIEGPRFSTRAESRMFRILGGDIINMSVAPEAALAFEAGIPYAVIALSTDYDSWRHDQEPVTWNEVLKVFQENVRQMTRLLVDVIGELDIKGNS